MTNFTSPLSMFVLTLAIVMPCLKGGDMNALSSEKDSKKIAVESTVASPFAVEITSGYDSLYLFNGVNSIPNAGIIWAGIAPSWNITANDAISVPLWYATAAGRTLHNGLQNYRELDIPVNYTHTFGNLSVGVGYLLYTYYNQPGTLPGGTAIQNSLEVNTSYTFKVGAVNVVPSLAYDYVLGTSTDYSYGSVNAGASFLSTALTVDVPVYKELVTFDPNLQYNFSFRYNNNEQGAPVTGANNFQIKAPLTWQINKVVSLTGYVAYSFQDQNLVGTQKNTVWAGGSVGFTF